MIKDLIYKAKVKLISKIQSCIWKDSRKDLFVNKNFTK
jgi:hypothetical protein